MNRKTKNTLKILLKRLFNLGTFFIGYYIILLSCKYNYPLGALLGLLLTHLKLKIINLK